MNETNIMDWPVDINWKCERCGEGPHWLQWDIAHGYCYCSVCGANYMMKDKRGKAVTTPISNTVEAWKEPLKEFWNEHKIPEWQMASEALEECKNKAYPV
jgi:hypothetical protein